jgi:uncharacterized protein (TIGR03067 family)
MFIKGRLTLILALVLATIATAQVPATLHGTWVITSAEGRKLPAGAHVAMVITADAYQGITNGTINERGTMKVDASAKPMTIDLAISEGTSAGKTQLAVAEVTGDTLRLALAEPGSAARPTAVTQQGLTLTKITPLADGLAGRWEATITIGSVSQRVALTLSNGPEGLATGTLGPADHTSTVPVNAVVQIGPTVRVIVSQARATFEGTLEGGELRGTWMQGPQSAPAVFKKP